VPKTGRIWGSAVQRKTGKVQRIGLLNGFVISLIKKTRGKLKIV